jgi:hypothetical protein
MLLCRISVRVENGTDGFTGNGWITPEQLDDPFELVANLLLPDHGP